jgi:hypothetical protein
LSDNYPVQNGLKQGDALSLLLFNFALEYAIKKVQGNQVRLKLNGTQQLLAYADGILGDNIEAINENTETLIYVSKVVGLEINVEKLRVYCCLITRTQDIKLQTERLKMCHSLNIWEQQ